MKKQSAIQKLKCGFYFDLDLYERTGKQIYLVCAKHILDKIFNKGYREVYKKIVLDYPTEKGGVQE